MASITNKKSKRGGGLKTIQFKYSTGGERYSIRLGKIDLKQAKKIAVKVEELLACKENALPWPMELSSWINAIGEDLTESLVKVGLLPTLKASTELKVFIENYIESRTDAKLNTRNAMVSAMKQAVSFFGAKTQMQTITRADCNNFKIHLQGKYSLAYTGTTIKTVKRFFIAAIHANQIIKNPFDGLKIPAQKNPERQFFVDRPMLEKLLEACPDHQWKMIIALARIGGLRTPCEVLLLKWTDINWHLKKFLVHSPKTEHHAGKDQRFVPLFPVLKELLEEGFNQAEDGEIYVINRYRNSNQNLRTTFKKIIIRAGLLPWPKLFNNLRSSRSTELVRGGCPMHLLTAYLGNSEKIQIDHYLQVNDTDFENSSRYEPCTNISGAKSGAWSDKKAVQQQNATVCKELQELQQTPTNKAFNDDSLQLETFPILDPMRPIGVEPKAISAISTNNLEKQDDSSGAKSGALVALIRQIVNLSDSELEKLSKALTNPNPDS